MLKIVKLYGARDSFPTPLYILSLASFKIIVITAYLKISLLLGDFLNKNLIFGAKSLSTQATKQAL